ncbi:hypothetical protein DFJ74DRAFT_431747 [Hyaloraphidium curvatum]|nr:hypothetical protein DFJ74DRAFT_431747 [Hyaloraphidium curvatum]
MKGTSPLLRNTSIDIVAPGRAAPFRRVVIFAIANEWWPCSRSGCTLGPPRTSMQSSYGVLGLTLALLLASAAALFNAFGKEGRMSPPDALSGTSASRRVSFAGAVSRTWGKDNRVASSSKGARPILDVASSSEGGRPRPDVCRLPLGFKRPLFGVLTTIFDVAEAARSFVAAAPNSSLVVIGDRKGPSSYNVSGGAGVLFYSDKDQDDPGKMGAFVDFAALMPYNSFSRKNLGYLKAIELGACLIWDFDDDNVLTVPDLWAAYAKATHPGVPHTNLDGLFGLRVRDGTKASTAPRSLNPYAVLGPSSRLWPRGFPPEHISSRRANMEPELVRLSPQAAQRIAVVQSAADGDPDVDAMYRLSQPSPKASFASSINVAYVSRPFYAPYNAQATLHTSIAFWALYLPISVHGRVSDIWRSYIAQAIFHVCGFVVGFAKPWVRHDRTAHDFVGDMRAESDLYDLSARLIEYLGEWSDEQAALLKRGDGFGNPLQMLEDIYIRLYERKVLEKSDVIGVQSWIRALSAVGYVPPDDICRPADWVASPQSAPFMPDVAASVHINHGHLQAVAPWNALYASAFGGNVFYHVQWEFGQTRTCRAMTANIECSHSFAHARQGDRAHVTMASDLAHPFFSPSSKHYLWQHDDMVLDFGRLLKALDEKQHCIGHCDSFFNLSALAPIGSPRMRRLWWWTEVNRNLAHMYVQQVPDLFRPGSACSTSPKGPNNTSDTQTLLSNSMLYAGAPWDFLFLNLQESCKPLVKTFVDALEKSASLGLHFEVALPTAALCSVPESRRLPVSVASSYKRDYRNNATRYFELYNPAKHDGLHPLKLGDERGVVAHLLMRDRFWRAALAAPL